MYVTTANKIDLKSKIWRILIAQNKSARDSSKIVYFIILLLYFHYRTDDNISLLLISAYIFVN